MIKNIMLVDYWSTEDRLYVYPVEPAVWRFEQFEIRTDYVELYYKQPPWQKK